MVLVSHVAEMREAIEDLIVLDKDPLTGDTIVRSGAAPAWPATRVVRPSVGGRRSREISPDAALNLRPRTADNPPEETSVRIA